MKEKAKILIVEDERIVAADLKATLEKKGYDVPDIISRGEDVFQAAQTHNPDLLLMDIKLEGEMDGIQAVREIKDNLNIPIIYLSALRDDSTRQRAQKTNPFGFLYKPIQDNELLAAVETALREHIR